ncbi:uncharacterized protein LOC126580936 [Anopheles aquasalis]|uniref:uncharacterized protein LOC126580936 n=1 Tax=Anopheles aquasalis TaxID=42839 RepID=UPI00215B61A5|nr:uncharacterized protein LOC126580936 [Anopheles aquasalis]
MDQLSNRNRKNILSLNHGDNWSSVPVVAPVTTGMASAQHHPIRHQQQQHLPRDVNGQQHHPTQPQDSNNRPNHQLHHHHHHHQHLQHQQQQQLQIDGLPKAFVAAMRTLFDIMDDRKTGFVRLADIEDRWLDDGSKGMPRGVIDSLRKVTPPSGMLSFERFCIGLKMCLVRNQPLSNGGSVDSVGSSSSSTTITTNTIAPAIPSPTSSSSPQAIEGKLGKLSLSRPPSAPLLDLDGALGLERKAPPPSVGPSWSNGSGVATPGSNTATVRPNNAMPAQKTLSMPQLLSPDEDGLEPPPIILPGAYGPPKPPRVSLNLERSNQRQHQHHTVQGTGTTLGSSIDKAEIRNALQNWQMSLLMGEASADKTGGVEKSGHGALRSLTTGRGSADGQTDLSASSPSLQSINQLDGSLGRSAPGASATLLPASLYQKKSTAVYGGGTGGRRREPRRHTLQTAPRICFKRLKQIEQEKDILVQGLAAVEQTRDWYLKQLAVVQEKIRYLGRPGSHMETWTETQQERLDLQRARVLEVNRHLMMLAESWERGGFPMHMNLALRPLPDSATYGSPYQQQRQQHQHQRTQSQSTPPAVPPPPSSASYLSAPSQQLSHQHLHHLQLQQQPPTELVNHLKAQNHQLVEEVSQKNEKLSLLEREKAALIRELMQLQRANRAASMISNTEEMVF